MLQKSECSCGGAEIEKSDNAFPWVSAHISGFNIGAPIEYAHSIYMWRYGVTSY